MVKLSIMKGTFDRSQATPPDVMVNKGVILAEKIIELRELEKEKNNDRR